MKRRVRRGKSTESPVRLRAGDGGLRKMVLELRTEKNILGCDGYTRYCVRLSGRDALAAEEVYPVRDMRIKVVTRGYSSLKTDISIFFETGGE